MAAPAGVVHPRMWPGLFLLTSVAALYLTWSNNLHFVFSEPEFGLWPEGSQLTPASLVTNMLPVMSKFLHVNFLTVINTAVMIELFFALVATWLFFQAEGIRCGIKGAWLYLMLGYYIGISWTFPIFAAFWLWARRKAATGEIKLAQPINVPGTVTTGYIVVTIAAFVGMVWSSKYPNASTWFDGWAVFYFASPVVVALASAKSDGTPRGLTPEASATLVWQGKLLAVLSALVGFVIRVQGLTFVVTTLMDPGHASLAEAAAAVVAAATGNGACTSIFLDYLLLMGAMTAVVVIDSGDRGGGHRLPATHRRAFVVLCIIAPSVAFPAYLAQRELDGRTLVARPLAGGRHRVEQLRTSRHVLVDVGMWWGLACIAMTSVEIVAMKLVPTQLEVWVFQHVFRSPSYHADQHEKFNVSTGDPWLAVCHVLGGLLYLLIIPFQLHAGFRKNNIGLHRWMGRAFFLASFVSAAGLWHMLRNPSVMWAGQSTWLFVLIFGGHFVISATFAAVYAGGRVPGVAKDIMAHRRWVIRHVANGIAPGAYRLVIMVGTQVVPWDTQPEPRLSFAVGFYMVWISMVMAAEAMVEHRYWEPTYPQPKTEAVVVSESDPGSDSASDSASEDDSDGSSNGHAKAD